MTQNNSTEQNSSLSQSLYNELEGLKIRIAFAEIDEDELNEYERNPSSVSESDYSDAAQKKALKLIERKLNKHLIKRFIRKTLPHTIQVVAITLLLFFIGLATAVATVQPFIHHVIVVPSPSSMAIPEFPFIVISIAFSLSISTFV